MDMHVQPPSLDALQKEVAAMLSVARSRRLLTEAIELSRQSDQQLGHQSLIQCREFKIDPIHVVHSSEQFAAIRDAVDFFIKHPNLLGNPNYTWDDHCATYPILKSLTEPDSPEGKERREVLFKLDCVQFVTRCYMRMRQLIANPEAI